MTAAVLSLHSPVGDLTIFEVEGAIVALDWGWGAKQNPTPLLEETKAQLHAYFDGERETFDIPLNPEGRAAQKRVWKAIEAVPYGHTRTYGDLARETGSVARAVGGACGANPIPILIPCHRIVASDGKLVGYSGDGGLETKDALLRLEGARLNL